MLAYMLENVIIIHKKGEVMKKFLATLALASISVQSALAVDVSSYFDQGLIYTGSSFPVNVAKNVEGNVPNIENLKCGEATTNNILGLVETGDRGVQAAARNGGITKIHYVDTKINKVYIPLGFIPIYVKQTKTLVYGE